MENNKYIGPTHQSQKGYAKNPNDIPNATLRNVMENNKCRIFTRV